MRHDLQSLIEMNDSYRLMWGREQRHKPNLNLDNSNNTNGIYQYNAIIQAMGGASQQDRMIQDKRRTLDRAVLYSYQAAEIKKYISSNVQVMDEEREMPPARALINPDKLKQDYDDKILSVRFECGFKPGDIFEWCNTNTYWLIYLQDLDELAYFRGEIRRCSYLIKWIDNGVEKQTYAAVRGPVETKINSLQNHKTIIDSPNYSLHILMPKTEDILKQFKRYTKFYLSSADNPDNKICWRVTATDSISTPGILEVEAEEYYSNIQEDDTENGIVGALIPEVENPNESTDNKIVFISGETFIKPKKEYTYSIGFSKANTTWIVDKKYPVNIEILDNSNGLSRVKIKWTATYSGQFDLQYGNYKKTIVVESLF